MSIYLDNAATTKLDPRVLQDMLPFLKNSYGNASSLHAQGQIARQAIEDARRVISKKIHSLPEEIIFTSGGTESNNLAILGAAQKLRKHGNHIITSQIEHSSILNACRELSLRNFRVTYLPVTREGIINPEVLENAITKKTVLVSLMHVNNETGAVQNVSSFAEICKRKKVLFHTDCVQSFLKVPFSLKKIPADFVSLSAHKIHGPKGIGALFVRKKESLHPLFFGGKQEYALRPGTENVSGIVGFSKAALLLKKEDCERMHGLYKKCIKGLLHISGITINGTTFQNVQSIINFSAAHVPSEDLLQYLNCKGIYVSAASACSSHKKGSYVLEALGLTQSQSENSIRLSLSKFTTSKEISNALEEIKKICNSVQKVT